MYFVQIRYLKNHTHNIQNFKQYLTNINRPYCYCTLYKRVQYLLVILYCIFFVRKTYAY